MSILVRVEGTSKDLKIMYPEPEEIQLNFCTLIDLEFKSFSSKAEKISEFTLNEAVALKIQTQEVLLQLDSNKKRFLLQCLIYPGENTVWVSCINNSVVTENSLDQLLMGRKPPLETITEEDDQSPYKRKIGQENRPGKENRPNHRGKQEKKTSPQKTKSPKKLSTKRTKKSTLRWSQSMTQTPKSPLKGDYVDALLAQLIQQNSKKSKTRKRRPSTSYPLRPKIDSEGMIDRQWLEEEMINEDL